MATLEERVEELETQVASLISVAANWPQVSDVVELIDGVETSLEENDTFHSSVTQRVNLLERYVSSLQQLLAYLNRSGTALKRNLTATTDPDVDDDASEGYSVGSDWVNATLDRYWMCVDSTTGAAVWKRLDS